MPDSVPAGSRSASETLRREIIAEDKPFHFHDIRARSATDDEQSAQQRLGHRTRAQTEDYLRDKRVVKVKPLPLKRSAA